MTIFGNNFGYKFPALDPSMCPPESADKCDCSIYDNEQDIAKNSSNVYQSVFNRISIIASGGIGGFENIDILSQYIGNSNLKISSSVRSSFSSINPFLTAESKITLESMPFPSSSISTIT